MKRVLSILLCILLLSIGSKANALEISDLEGYTEVSTVEQFDAAFKNHENIRLMADIDMTNSTCNYGSRVAGGDLTHVDYQHGTITGLKERYDGSEEPYFALKNLNHVLWDDISNINLKHIVISGATSSLFAFTKDCEISEVFFEQCGIADEDEEIQSLFTIVDERSTFAHIVILGSMLYWTNSEWSIHLTNDHDGAGFLAATKIGGTIEDVFVCSTSAIYGEDGEVGSLVGEAHDINISDVQCFATVMGYGDRCGGIVGYADKVNLSDCHFYGMVKQAKIDGMGTLESILRTFDVNEFYNIYSYYALAYSPCSVWSVLHITALTVRDFAAAQEALASSTCFLTNLACVPFSFFIKNATVKFCITFAVHSFMGAWAALAIAMFATECIGNFSGPDEVGGIAGYLSNGSISKCSNYGMLYALDAYAGGIVGYAEKTTITKCLNHGAVHGDEQTGGLVGYLEDGTISHSLNIGTISCANTEHAGRIVGETAGKVTKSYNYFADKESDINDTSKKDSIRLDISDFVSGAAAWYMNSKCGEEIWYQAVGSTPWPTLSTAEGKAPKEIDIDRSVSTVLKVKDRSSLLAAMVYPYAEIDVEADIDMDGYPAFNLSSAYMPFMGTIRGNGHHIKNISFTQNDKTYIFYGLQGLFMEVQNVGLFGVTKGAYIENLHFDNIQLDLACNMQNVGLLVGFSRNSTYKNITMTGKIFESDGKDHSIYRLGGMIGFSLDDVLENCIMEEGSSLYCWGSTLEPVEMGGLVGSCKGTTFKSCTNYATVRGQDDMVGGIVGDFGTLSYCHSCVNYGRVEGYENTGGIAGSAGSGSLVRCANYGTVIGASDFLSTLTNSSYMKDCVGGLAGYITDLNIIESVNYGSVFGDDYVAGIGGGYWGTARIINCVNMGKIQGDDTDPICGGFTGPITDLSSRNLIKQYNYHLADSRTATGDGGTTFTSDQIPNGSIAMIMNQDLINNEKEAVWRQDLGKDYLPSNVDTTKPLVNSTISEVDLVIPVYSANDFYMAIYHNPAVKISLQSDIDLYSLDYNLGTKDNRFTGVVEGNGHVISNLQVLVPEGRPAGLFGYVKNATFKNLVIDNFHFTQALNTLNGQCYEGLLVSESEGCIFKNITIRNSSITLNKDKDYLERVGGLVAYSKSDIIEDITIDGSCEFYGYSGALNTSIYVGGVAGDAEGTTFTRCHNAAHVWCDDNRVGGICGEATEGCKFDGCLNSGWIEGQEYVGGIAGYVSDNTEITRCVNIGTISDDEHKAESYRGGIVGCMDDDSVESYCMNFGTVYDMGSHCGALEGALEGDSYLFGWNYYNFETNGGKGGNNNNEFSENMDEAIPSGLFAHKWDFYQSIDNDGYITDKPVPIPAAGTVYLNHRCDGDSVYTNLFHGEKGHTPTPDIFGFCQYCGRQLKSYLSAHISEAAQLKQLASFVAAGNPEVCIYLEDDIDMSELGDWVGIGSQAHPFCGTFNGLGHRILNMHAVPHPQSRNGGLFACVGPGAVIEDLIIDASCQVTGDGVGVAGIAGCVSGEETSTEKFVLFIRCGNEANVTGESNVAGILGGVYNNPAQIYIYDCYNTGAITGGSESAAIIASGQGQLDIERCWNIGNVKGADPFHSMFRYVSGTSTYITDNYYSESLSTKEDFAKVISAQQIATGKLCYLLNTANTDASEDVWGQNLGTEVYPTFSTSGLRHERTTKSHWGTVMLPFELTSSDDVTFYEISGLSADFTLTLQPVQTVAPNTPCFFSVAEGISQVTFSFADNEWKDSDTTIKNKAMTLDSGKNLWLIGSYQGYTIEPDKREKPVYNYFIAQDKLWWGEVKFDLPPYRAYLCIGDKDESKMARVLSLNVIDEEGIEQVRVDDLFGTDTQYNLNGQRQQAGQKGLQIKNGRVIMVK